MKKILKIYYNFDVTNYENYDGGIIFFYNSSYFYFCKCFFDEEYLINLRKFCFKLPNFYFHSLIYNKNGYLKSEDYVLMKLNSFIDDVIFDDIFMFFKYNFSFFKDKYLSFDKIWEYRIDYLERQLDEISLSNLINNNIDYFIGICETLLIFYKKNINDNELNLSLSHNKMNTLSSVEFFNPLNLSVDCNLKDFARYIKLTKNEQKIVGCLNSLNYSEKCYLFVRLVFPFEFFHEVSEILLDSKKENELIDIINNVGEYEEYIYRVEEIFGIFLFSWIKKE